MMVVMVPIVTSTSPPVARVLRSSYAFFVATYSFVVIRVIIAAEQWEWAQPLELTIVAQLLTDLHRIEEVIYHQHKLPGHHMTMGGCHMIPMLRVVLLSPTRPPGCLKLLPVITLRLSRKISNHLLGSS